MPFIIDVNPVIASLGGFAIRWYSLTLLAAAAVAILVFNHEARRKQLDERATLDGIWWVAIAAIVGGRVLYELQNDLPMLGADPFHVLMVWQGGLSFYGGLIAAVLAIVVFARRRGLPLWPVLDAAAPAAAIGQAIGHIGCLITGDSFGLPTTLPWAVIYRNPAAMAPLGVSLQPTQAYEAIALGLLFAALWVGRDRLAHLGAGGVAGSYLVGVAAVRFVLFFLRDEHAVFFGLKTAQLIGVGLAIGGAVILANLIRRRLAASPLTSKEMALT
jgi:phosphatidylglycerol:prolipoprotein diacylglycerol transferase